MRLNLSKVDIVDNADIAFINYSYESDLCHSGVKRCQNMLTLGILEDFEKINTNSPVCVSYN